MNITEIIRKRKSCRTFSGTLLHEAHQNILKQYISALQSLSGEELHLEIIEKAGAAVTMKLDYGMIKGHNTYLLGKSLATKEARINYGYVCEKVVLKATELDIATCWIGIFDHEYFGEISIDKDFEIPSIVILGYPEEKPSGIEMILRMAVRASRRLDWEKLFFDYHTGKPLVDKHVLKYADSLEMLRLAPSAGNTQPWRIFFDATTSEFHFYKKLVNKKYEAIGLHDIDMGISMAHFELTTQYLKLPGEWHKYGTKEIKNADNLQYIISWRSK